MSAWGRWNPCRCPCDLRGHRLYGWGGGAPLGWGALMVNKAVGMFVRLRPVPFGGRGGGPPRGRGARREGSGAGGRGRLLHGGSWGRLLFPAAWRARLGPLLGAGGDARPDGGAPEPPRGARPVPRAPEPP